MSNLRISALNTGGRANSAGFPRPSKAPAASRSDSNVDPDEVAYYENLAATWWNRIGPFWPLHRLNDVRTSYLRQVVSSMFDRDSLDPRPLEGLNVVDVGCGGGILSEAMAKLGANVLGIDVVDRNVEAARAHAAATEVAVSYEAASASTLARRGAEFDLVLNMEVVEHVPHVPTFINDCARLVRPGGAMAVATINRTAKAWLFAIVGAEYVMRWLPRGTHRWSRFVKPSEIESSLHERGFVPAARCGVRINPITKNFSLTKSMAVNYMVVARKSRSAAALDGRMR